MFANELNALDQPWVMTRFWVRKTKHALTIKNYHKHPLDWMAELQNLGDVSSEEAFLSGTQYFQYVIS